ncbi:hypothetical protein HBB16_02080 [Pseudonocardia sp. MCCB 268]|nr:hypothetical protein [Pseudonocardia cytotoxica]
MEHGYAGATIPLIAREAGVADRDRVPRGRGQGRAARRGGAGALAGGLEQPSAGRAGPASGG